MKRKISRSKGSSVPLAPIPIAPLRELYMVRTSDGDILYCGPSLKMAALVRPLSGEIAWLESYTMYRITSSVLS